MPEFVMETTLPVSPETLAYDLLNMSGVNEELFPYLKMTSPNAWQHKPIAEWPRNESLFTSTILLLGLIPIDRHEFRMIDVDPSGFKESSRSWTNHEWQHERKISAHQMGATVKDVVTYQSKVALMGRLFLPVYRLVFKHRHRRLAKKYSLKTD